MQLNPTRFKSAEYVANIWAITVEEGVTLKDIQSEDFFAHVAQQLKPYDKILVRTDDGAFYAELLVVRTGKTWAFTEVLVNKELSAKVPEKSPSDDYQVAYKGPHRKWCIIRTKDKALVHEGEDSKESAYRWLAEYLQVAA